MTRLTRHEDDSAREIARHATTQSFLNCYVHETGAGQFRPADETPIDADGQVLHCPLDEQDIDLYAPVAYRSPTGRHLFETPVSYRAGGPIHDCDYLTLATLLTKELALTRGGDADRDELLARVVSSCRAIERYVDARRGDDALTGPDATFREAEQSLAFGHLTHPTPKSRRGMGRDGPRYAPELGASFPLHYVRADPALVSQDSTREHSAAEWVEQALREDPAVPDGLVDRHTDDGVLVPLHPWQAQYLLDREPAQTWLADGRLESLDQLGREFAPTSSVRTLYAPRSPFMVKGSLAVRITNAERTNKRPELDRGVAISELLGTELGDALDERFPDFDVMQDPAYLTLETDDERAESGFEVVLRENPFCPGGERQTTPVVALCQDGIDGPSRLERLVRDVADSEGRAVADVSVDWFDRYCETVLRPVLWLFLEWGLGLEAHQQNTVVRLADGYPDRAFYRDNQGYYFPEGAYDRIDEVCPGVGERADTICPDAVADERIRYYVVLNNAFGVINAFGTAGLVEECRLLAVLRDELESLRQFDRASSSLLDPLLGSGTVPRKANLLTRFRGLDELDAPSLDDQSVYAEVPNPLVRDLEREVPR